MSVNWDDFMEIRRLEFSDKNHIVWKKDWMLARPNWAHWIAQDASGAWWAYEYEPNMSHNGWYENESGNCVQVFKEIPNLLWKSTLMQLDPISVD